MSEALFFKYISHSVSRLFYQNCNRTMSLKLLNHLFMTLFANKEKNQFKSKHKIVFGLILQVNTVQIWYM